MKDKQLYEYSEEEQLQYLNELQQTANAAMRHEPELLADMHKQVVNTALEMGISFNRMVTYNGRDWN